MSARNHSEPEPMTRHNVFCEACGERLEHVPRRRGRCAAILCLDCRHQATIDADGYIEDNFKIRPEPKDMDQSDQLGAGWTL